MGTIGPVRLLQRLLARDRYEGTHTGVVPVDLLERTFRQRARGDLSRAQILRQLRGGHPPQPVGAGAGGRVRGRPNLTKGLEKPTSRRLTDTRTDVRTMSTHKKKENR